jgi:hypothetical protein
VSGGSKIETSITAAIAAWQHFERNATAVVLPGVLDDVELSCASRAAFLPFLLQVAFLCSCIGPLMNF